MGDQTGEHEAAANIAEGLVHICHQRDRKAANHIRPFLSFLACFTLQALPYCALIMIEENCENVHCAKTVRQNPQGYWALYMQLLRS